MARKLVLDTGPLGVAANASGVGKRDAIRAWLGAMGRAGAVVIVPGIADYELRREMILRGMGDAIGRLDLLKKGDLYVPISEKVMLKAADLWAHVRAKGTPTAGDQALDGDCIVAATAWTATAPSPWAAGRSSSACSSSRAGACCRMPGPDAGHRSGPDHRLLDTLVRET